MAGDIARTCWLTAGYSEAVPGVTIDRQCGSSQQALHFAAQAVMSGTMELVVAGGVGANKQLRVRLNDEAKRKRFRVHYPELEFCTDNGAMIALAGCLRLQAGTPPKPAGDFAVQPRWPLMDMSASGAK